MSISPIWFQTCDTLIGQDDGKWNDDEEEVLLKGNGERPSDAQHLLIVKVPVIRADRKPVPDQEEERDRKNRHQGEPDAPQNSNLESPFEPPRASCSEDKHHEIPVSGHTQWLHGISLLLQTKH